jgi:rare lipoprotein A
MHGIYKGEKKIMRNRTFNVLMAVFQAVTILTVLFMCGWGLFNAPAAQPATVLIYTAFPAARVVPSLRVLESGIASWYGPGYQGKMTAGGFRFDMRRHTLACNHLPFGTIVRVTNRKTGQSCVGMVTDRGPNVPGRKYDLSRAMAEKIGMIQDGLATVTVELLL